MTFHCMVDTLEVSLDRYLPRKGGNKEIVMQEADIEHASTSLRTKIIAGLNRMRNRMYMYI